MWEPVTLGMSGARVQRRPGVYRKFTQDADVEARALSWLRLQGLPAAEVLDVGADWLLTREVQGRGAADPWPAGDLDRVVDALAEVTRALHVLPAESCPFDRTLSVTVPEARAAAKEGRVDLANLDPERQGWDAPRLVRELEWLLPAAQAAEDVVVTHGDWCLPNILLDPQTIEVVGIVDAARAGRAGRCMDLALMNRSLRSAHLNPQYGPARAERYLARCGANDAADKLAFYELLDEFF